MRKLVAMVFMLVACNMAIAVPQMSIKLASQWELVNQEGTSETMRLSVIGGWLVRTRIWNPNGDTMVFVPDANHEWKL